VAYDTIAASGSAISISNDIGLRRTAAVVVPSSPFGASSDNLPRRGRRLQTGSIAYCVKRGRLFR
jgi:hypothetical protein